MSVVISQTAMCNILLFDVRDSKFWESNDVSREAIPISAMKSEDLENCDVQQIHHSCYSPSFDA
jgi:hypothetical protein